MEKMEFKRTETTLIGGADVLTPNARYDVSYTIVGSELQSVSAAILVTRQEEIPLADGGVEIQPREVSMGRLVMAGGQVMAESLAYSSGVSLYMADFVAIVDEILRPKETASNGNAAVE